MRRELTAVLDEIEADAEARVLILTGAGGHFCSGGDVKTMRERRHTAAEGRGRVELLNAMVQRLVSFPKPTIAMVDGYAVGAGSNLALCCDLIVASERAKFGELFWKIGLVPDGGGTWLLPRVVGLARAKELIFTADIIDAAEAERIGLVNRVVPLGNPDPRPRALPRKSPPAPPPGSRWPSTWSTEPPRPIWRPPSTSRPSPRASPSPPRTTGKDWPPSSKNAPPNSPGARPSEGASMAPSDASPRKGLRRQSRRSKARL